MNIYILLKNYLEFFFYNLYAKLKKKIKEILIVKIK